MSLSSIIYIWELVGSQMLMLQVMLKEYTEKETCKTRKIKRAKEMELGKEIARER